MKCKMWEGESRKYLFIEIAIGIACVVISCLAFQNALAEYELYRFASIPLGFGLVGFGLARLIIFGFFRKG